VSHCLTRQFSGGEPTREWRHFQELMTVAHLLGNGATRLHDALLRRRPAIRWPITDQMNQTKSLECTACSSDCMDKAVLST